MAKEIKREDTLLDRHPIFLSETTVAVITLFHLRNDLTIHDMFLLDYINARKQQGEVAEQILACLKDHMSINFLWSLKEACDKQILLHNKECGSQHPLNRPEGR